MAKPSYAATSTLVEFTVNSFIVEGDNQLSEQKTTQILRNFLGKHEGLDRLRSAAKAIEKAHAEQGNSFYRVTLPPQTMDNNVVTLRVLVFKLGETTVIGHSYFSDEQILRSLPALKQGHSPNTRDIARALTLANKHPSREHIVNIKKGRKEDTVDAEIKVKDSRPYLLFAGLNNIGAVETGRVRVIAGGQHTNLLGLDDTLTVSYTTSQLEPEDVKQYGFSYSLPLYDWTSTVNVFYSKSDVNTGEINSFDISGAGEFSGFNFTHILNQYSHYSHEVSFGIMDKFFENNAVFSGVNFAADVRSRPLNFSYMAKYKTSKFQLGVSASFDINTGLGTNNDDADYIANRAEADSHWKRWNVDSYINYYLEKDWIVRGIFEGQHANEALISGEQFGLGGVNSVRGFEERAIAGDSGIRLSGELWFPAIKSLNNLRMLTFIDYGYMDIEKVQVGGEDNDSIMSIGIGARWNLKKTVNLTVDYGYVINEAEHLQGTSADSGNAKFHLNLFVRY